MTGPAPLWLRHDAHLEHAVPGHPERPDRLTGLEALSLLQRLKSKL